MDEMVDIAAGRAAGGAEAAAAGRASRLLDDERRLFYVAVTRARRSLLVTAVGAADSEERPSRFLAELAADGAEVGQAAASPRRWLSLPALVAELRRSAADRGLPPQVRQAAAGQLARLAAAGVTSASPDRWYALTQWTGTGPVISGPARISPSQLEKFLTCGLRWLLESAVGAAPPSAAGHFGTVIHAAAALVAEGADISLVGKRIDEIWHQLDFGSAWYSARQRELAQDMVGKFIAWHQANPRELVAVEQRLVARVGQALITGRVDRLERAADGTAVVVDLKTVTSPVPDRDLARHPQLGVYQLAVLLGAFAELGLTEPGGAELVQLGKASYARSARVQPQPPLREDPEPRWAEDLVRSVAEGMAGPEFQAVVNAKCRNCPVASCCPVDERGAPVRP
jgi:RecB family exonuclease